MSVRATVFCSGVIFSVFPAWEWPSLPGPGVYMLCRRDLSGSRAILYVGQASNLANRLGAGHEHWAEALALGMNEVLVHLLADTEAERLAIETRLRRLNPTPLNRQGGGLGLGAPPSPLGLGGPAEGTGTRAWKVREPLRGGADAAPAPQSLR